MPPSIAPSSTGSARPLEIWVVCVGEPLPTDGGDPRLLRAGMMATLLSERGHVVTWWTSSFYHAKREHRCAHDTALRWGPRATIRLLRGLGYQHTVSISRLLDHRVLGLKFRRAARREPRPDLIYVCLPTLELACESVRYGRERGVPVVVDIRDQWPTIFLERVPALVEPAARLALTPLFHELDEACRGASALTGITEQFVDWGAARAGRARRPEDAVLPLAYWPDPPAADALAQARASWDRSGLGTNGEFVVCFFGAMNRHCRLDDVIEAARVLGRDSTDGPRFQFVLAGSGQQLDDYRAQARGLDNVVFPGWIDRPEIWAAMERSSLGLIPYDPTQTFLDSIPNKVAEYCSAGLPIVTTLGAGQLGELLATHELGRCYGAGDPAGLARALTELAAMPEAEATKLRRRSLALFEARYDARVVYGRFIDGLEALASASGPTSGPGPRSTTEAA